MISLERKPYQCLDCGQEKYENTGGIVSYIFDTGAAAGRLEYIGGLLFFSPIFMVAWYLRWLVDVSTPDMYAIAIVLSVLAMYVCSIAFVSLVIRRNKDAGYRSITAFLFFMPIIGLFYALWLSFAKGVEVSNDEPLPAFNLVFLLIKGLVGLLIIPMHFVLLVELPTLLLLVSNLV